MLLTDTVLSDPAQETSWTSNKSPQTSKNWS